MGLSEEIKKINAEINKLRKELGAKPLKPFKQEDLEQAKYTLQGLRSEVREMGSDLDYVSKAFRDSVNELSRQNEYLKDARKSLSSISDIARKITDYRRGESSLSEKQLKNLQSQARVKFESLKNDLKSGQLTKEQAKEVRYALDQQEVFNESVETTIKHQKQVNKEIGLVGQGIGGIGKALQKLGFGDLSQPLQDAVDKTKDARLQQKLNNDELSKTQSEIDKIVKKEGLVLSEKQLQAGFGGIELKNLANKKESLESQNKELSTQTSKYKNIGGALTDQLTKFNLIDFSIMGIINALASTDKAVGDMAKSMNITYSEALDVRKELTGIANSSMDTAVNTRGLQESMMAVNAATGARVKLNDKDLITFTKLREQAGLANDEIYGIQQLSTLNNKTLEETNEELLGAAQTYAGKNKLAINEKEILKDVSKVSNSLKLSLGGSVEKLAEAAIKTRQFGLNLEQAENIASSLLDFESSIESELSAELLTGKSLNLEKARGLALSGDAAGAAAELAKQMGSAEDFGKMNVIQQEALAKSIGMGRDELAKSLMDKQMLIKLGGKEGQDAQQRYNELRDQGLSQAQIQAKLGKDANTDMMEQQSLQEKFNQTVEKLKEIFMNVANALMPVFDTLSGVFDIMGPIVGLVMDWGKYLLPIIAGMKTFLLVSTAIKAIKEKGLVLTLREAAVKTGLMAKEKAGYLLDIGKAAMGAIKSLSSIPVIGWALGLAAAGTVAALGYSYMKDGVIGPGGETIVSGPKGSIQLDKDDSMIVGTDLGGKKKPSSSGGGGVTVNMEPTNALLRQLIAAVNTGGTVTLDGQKVGEALKLGAYKTQ